MKLDLSEILSHVGMRFPYEIDEPPLVDEDLECAEPIRGNMVFTNTGSILLVDGQASTSVVMPCSRCLAYYGEPITVYIDEQFEMETKPAGPRGRQTNVVVIEEDESPAAGKLFDGPLFDLTELLRQGITLALPTQPLHDENCKGICAACGQNLNEAACSCDHHVVNPALAKLGALLEEKDKA
jgi:uncharacterized protein